MRRALRAALEDIRTTLGIYAHAVEEADRQAADTLGARFMGAGEVGARDGRAMGRSEGQQGSGAKVQLSRTFKRVTEGT